jgi:hypothetical protein
MRVLLVLILLVSSSALAEKTNPQKRNTGSQASESKQNPAKPPNAAIGECFNCFDIQTPHAETEKHDAYDARTDSLYRWYLRATIIGVCGGLIGLVFLILQTIATHTAADAAKKSAEALIKSERAWINVEVNTSEKLTEVRLPPTLDQFWIWPRIKNYGKTPARITRIVIRPHLLPAAIPNLPQHIPPQLPPEPEYASELTADSEAEIMVPPQVEISPFPAGIDVSDFERIKQRVEFLYVYGYVNYTDISGLHRQTRFCQLYWVPFGIKDPHGEDFLWYRNTPAAYTEST